MSYSLGLRSKKNLIGVHPDLVKVVKRAIQLTSVDFTVIEGLRTVERQQKLVASGASKTMRSRHLTGHAVDIVPYVGGRIRWDWPLFDPIESAMKEAAQLEDVPIEWGGDWLRFKDGPHWQLPWDKYQL
jgi:peptidoglycan L-alanyl-D-glutamate endopeptidase CwlK